LREYLELFWAFIVVGTTTFGGGYAILPVLERELIKKRGWLTLDEVMDFFTIAQITPGIIAVNIATFAGCKRKGYFGGTVATIGLILPGVTLILIISMFFKHFAEHAVVRHALAGIRVAVCALVLDVTIKLFKDIYKNYKAVIISVTAFAVSVVFSVSPVYIILGAGLVGFLLFSPRRKGGVATKGGESGIYYYFTWNFSRSGFSLWGAALPHCRFCFI
jgi:chromate transporter